MEGGKELTTCKEYFFFSEEGWVGGGRGDGGGGGSRNFPEGYCTLDRVDGDDSTVWARGGDGKI